MAPILGLVIAYFSGHVLERALPLLIISLLIGLNFHNLLEKAKSNGKCIFLENKKE